VNMAVKAAFIFVVPGSNPERDKAVVKNEQVELHVAGVSSYEEGAELAKKFVDQGITCIELCGGFGNEGVGIVAKAVRGKARVGVVRFDLHPALDNKSGDDLLL